MSLTIIFKITNDIVWQKKNLRGRKIWGGGRGGGREKGRDAMGRGRGRGEGTHESWQSFFLVDLIFLTSCIETIKKVLTFFNFFNIL